MLHNGPQRIRTKSYQQVYGAPDAVAHVVTIGGNFHGTTLNGFLQGPLPIIINTPKLAAFLASTTAIQQVEGSEFMQRLNALPDTSAGTLYNSIYSPTDVTVTPNSASQLTAVWGADVVNLDLGEVCGAEPVHPQLPKSKEAIADIVWGLTRAEGEQSRAGRCVV